MLKLPFGLKDGHLVSIDEVERGLACGCTCSNCGAQLIARKGKKKTHHFAHHNSPECRYAVETAIHLAAKEIIQKEKRLLLPPLEASVNIEKELEELEREFQMYFFAEGHGIDLNSIVQLYPDMMLKVDDVVLEKQFNDFRPDLILFVRGKKLIVEVVVTHGIDDDKLEKIRAAEVPVVEVYLGDLHDGSQVTLEQIRKALMEEVWNKSWIYNPKREKLQDKFKKEHVARLKEKMTEIHQNLYQEEKMLEQKSQQKEQREEFYKSYYKKVITRETKTGRAQQVKPCEIESRNFHGSTYANIYADCFDCEHFRGYRNFNRDIVCLAPYNLKKQKSSQQVKRVDSQPN